MKVYIVTQGEYSDYCIKRVFLDQNKAQDYANSVPNSNDPLEFETDDNVKLKCYYSIILNYRYNVCPTGMNKDIAEFYIDFSKNNYLDNPIPYEHTVHYSYLNNLDEIEIRRTIDKEKLTKEDESYYREKYKKVCYDLAGQIKYMKEIEKLDIDQINERLKG